jgi:hypothetical protein
MVMVLLLALEFSHGNPGVWSVLLLSAIIGSGSTACTPPLNDAVSHRSWCNVATITMAFARSAWVLPSCLVSSCLVWSGTRFRTIELGFYQHPLEALLRQQRAYTI